ncbi:H-NS histone family protein [Paraburkholderia sp. RL18-103-BIB-C]|jgi:DNA-binding protein H-NS|uniref:H-NS family nucleoid-associated regulatory protein n=1 Tax=unclassified Paraburkholderia TaxID=2615204 RepID=UPI0038B807A0
MARSYDVIQAEILKLQREAEEALTDARNEAIKRIRAEMAKFGISADELRELAPVGHGGARAKNRAAATAPERNTAVIGESDESPAVRLLEDAGIDFRRKAPAPAASPAQAKLAPKYRDPKTGATWSGHARPPAWIRDARDRSVFLIDRSAAPVTRPAKKAATKIARTALKKAPLPKVAARGSNKPKDSVSR